MNKKALPIIILVVVVGVGAFFGGMKYGQSKGGPGGFSQADFQEMRNLSPEERQQRLQELGANVGSAFGGARGGVKLVGGVAGEIIARDEQSITVELSDGGSKIVFFSDSTAMVKSIEASKNDLTVGEQVMVSGQENSDGSYTARTIRLNEAITPVRD